jgi:hypothetical protein
MEETGKENRQLLAAVHLRYGGRVESIESFTLILETRHATVRRI